jgi:cytochrome c2
MAPIVLATILAALVAGCGKTSSPVPGDPERGRELLAQYGCGYCHEIRGVRGARGKVGPPLDNIGRRVYLAGMLVNSPNELARWIRTPKTIKPQTAMPDLGVTFADSQDMSAYLTRLR